MKNFVGPNPSPAATPSIIHTKEDLIIHMGIMKLNHQGIINFKYD